MQFVKSLFCRQGLDNRVRFFAISFTVYLVFMILASTFSSSLLISIFFILLSSSLIALTSLRRLHDAQLNKNWFLAPSASFAIVAIVIIVSLQPSSYYLIFIPVLFSGVLLTYASKNNSQNKTYILGYVGPVDMSEYRQEAHQGKSAKFRIEPSLAGEQSTNFDQFEERIQPNSTTYQQHNHTSEQQDIGEWIRLSIMGNKKAQLAIFSAITLVILTVIISWSMTFFSDPNPNESTDEKVQISTPLKNPLIKEHPLAMPDNFTLFLTQHQGLIINWHADTTQKTLLWSQLSAQGDESCKEINFNNGLAIRTLTVDAETDEAGNSDYFASFSPLDSQALIQALAFKGSFSLCGYDFSLKGSQAVLGKNNVYAQWLEY